MQGAAAPHPYKYYPPNCTSTFIPARKLVGIVSRSMVTLYTTSPPMEVAGRAMSATFAATFRFNGFTRTVTMPGRPLPCEHLAQVGGLDAQVVQVCQRRLGLILTGCYPTDQRTPALTTRVPQ